MEKCLSAVIVRTLCIIHTLSPGCRATFSYICSSQKDKEHTIVAVMHLGSRIRVSDVGHPVKKHHCGMRSECWRSDADPHQIDGCAFEMLAAQQVLLRLICAWTQSRVVCRERSHLISITGARHVTPIVLFTLVSGCPEGMIGCHGLEVEVTADCFICTPQQELRSFSSS